MRDLREEFLSIGYSEEEATALAHIAEQCISEDIGHIENIGQVSEELVDAFNRIGCTSFQMTTEELSHIIKE